MYLKLFFFIELYYTNMQINDLSTTNLKGTQTQFTNIYQSIQIDQNKLGYTAIYASNNYIVASSGDSKLTIYKQENYIIKKIMSMIPHANPICCLCILDKFIFTTEKKQDPLIKIWNLDDTSLIRTLKGHSKKVTQIACRDLNLFASTSEDKTAKVWRRSQKEEEDIITLEHQFPVLAVEFFEQKLLLTGGDDCFLNIWNWKAKLKVKTVISHINSLNFICIKGQSIITGGGDGFIKFWSIDSLVKRNDYLIVTMEKEIQVSSYQTTFYCKANDQFYFCDSQNKLFLLNEENQLIQLTINIPYEQRIRGIGYYKNSLIIITDIGKLTSWRNL